MTRPLGKHQLRLLYVMAPGRFLVVPNRISDSLERRGLVARLKPEAMVYITAAGLRALADAIDAGRVAYPPTLPKKLSTRPYNKEGVA